jgi:hypothetical protein
VDSHHLARVQRAGVEAVPTVGDRNAAISTGRVLERGKNRSIGLVDHWGENKDLRNE